MSSSFDAATAATFEFADLGRPSAGEPVASVVVEPERDFDGELAAARDDGFAAGLAAARAELAPAAEALRGALAALEAEHAAAADAVAGEAAELAVQVAEKVVAGAFDAQPELVVDVVRSALRRIVDSRELIVLVNPDDVEIVSEALPDTSVQPERRVPRGGCTVQTADGEIDARLATQIERAREAVAESLRA